LKYNDRISLGDRLRYLFDRNVARGPLVLAGWAALFVALVILVLSLGVLFTHVNAGKSLPVILWTMVLQALAPNPVDVSAGPWPFLCVMLLITLLGIFMVSIFIGTVTTGIDGKIQSLRKGRSRVIEEDHTVILGWDEHIFTILSELCINNQHHARCCVVIMGEKDKVEMEEEIRARIGSTGHMEIVCRSGNPIDMVDLEIVSINTSKSIIILAPDIQNPDSYIIKALLAVTNNPKRRNEPYHIVTEIHNNSNIEPAILAGKNEATILLINDIIAHIIAQTCRQSGLSTVHAELLNFSGDEIYFKEEPTLVGKTFAEALFLFEDSTLIGVRSQEGKPQLNPGMDTILNEGDQIIVISEEKETIYLSGMDKPAVRSELMQGLQTKPLGPEQTIILGWNSLGSTIESELDHYVVPGSSVTIVSSTNELENEIAEIQAGLQNQIVSYKKGDITDRGLLDTLGIQNFQHAIVLADQVDDSIQLTDARTIITLLHLRDIAEKSGHPFSIVSEMLDVRNRELAEIAHADDFIVSDELASLMMAQISENEELYLVFEYLFDSEGSEIYLKPISDYIVLNQPVDFYTILESARLRNEVAIGYRLAKFSGDRSNGFGIVINPDKSNMVVFQEQDQMIVIAPK
jgi:voltage-gated potassium channel Kch